MVTHSSLLMTTLVSLLLFVHPTTAAAVPSEKLLRGQGTKDVVDTTLGSLEQQQQVQEQRVLNEPETIENDHRDLQELNDIGNLLRQMANTPIQQWTGGQWLLLLILLMLLSCLCNCLCTRRPYYGRRYYGGSGYYGGGYRNSGSGGGSCLSNIFWCACCYEWCCRDCQDVEACCGAVGDYTGGQMA